MEPFLPLLGSLDTVLVVKLMVLFLNPELTGKQEYLRLLSSLVPFSIRKMMGLLKSPLILRMCSVLEEAPLALATRITVDALVNFVEVGGCY